MLQTATDRYIDAFWVMPNLPQGVRVWCHKLLHLKSLGNFFNVQTSVYHVVRYVIKGSGLVKVNSISYNINAGMMFSALPGVYIEMRDTPDNPWQWLELQLTGEDAGCLVQGMGFVSGNPVVELPDWRAGRVWRRMFAYYRREDRTPYQAVSLLYEFVDACGAAHNYREQDSGYGRLVDMARSIIESQGRLEINVNDLARRLGVERSTLFRAFREELEMTPSQYVNAKRLAMAVDMLANTGLKVSSIAALCGFSSDKYFINWFGAHKGCSPAKWRRSRPVLPTT